MKKTDKILVTGASGFIGSRLTNYLIKNGYSNIHTTTFSRNIPNELHQDVKNTIGDLRESAFCDVLTKDVDVVFHCAANTSNALDTKENPLLHVTPNVEMNVNLMEQSW